MLELQQRKKARLEHLRAGGNAAAGCDALWAPLRAVGMIYSPATAKRPRLEPPRSGVGPDVPGHDYREQEQPN